MAVLHDKSPELAVIAAKLVMSTGCTDAIGCVMTSGTPDNETSALLTWEPAFVSAPIAFATINSGGATTTSPMVRFTGVGVTTAYITYGESPLSGVTIGIVLMGEARL